MSNLEQYKNAFFIGIGGIGMSALARYFKSLGVSVAGYDKTPSPLTDALQKEGIHVGFADNPQGIPAGMLENPGQTLFVYTPAVPKNHKQWNYLRNNGIAVLKRSEVLAAISRDNFCIAVAGTHGKTTTSTLLAHIFYCCNKNFSAFLGGISTNYHTNFISKSDGNEIFATKKIMIMEADEFDRSFHRLSPDIAVITSIDADHLDIYHTESEFKEAFEIFSNKIVPGGTLVMKQGLGIKTRAKTISYGVDNDTGAAAINLRHTGGSMTFDYQYNAGKLENVRAGLPGKHNVENAVAAITVARFLGLNNDCITGAVASFSGAQRRFEYIVNTGKYTVIDDYAHHPGELEAFIGAVKSMYPGKKLTGIFQPHLFTRTRDFEDGFAASLSMLDELIMMEIYPAREEPIEGINSARLLQKVNIARSALLTPEKIYEKIEQEKPELLLIMGAGDIDRIVPQIKKIYNGV